MWMRQEDAIQGQQLLDITKGKYVNTILTVEDKLMTFYSCD